MKNKTWLKIFLAGIGIGVGAAIPGVSGGTIAVILKVYEKIIWAVSHLFKEFRKAFKIVLPAILGVIIGLIPTMVLMKFALDGFVFGVVCIFAGYIIGSLPSLKKEVNDEKPKSIYIALLILSALIAIILGVLSVVIKVDLMSHFVKPEIYFYFVMIPVGFVASVALVVPGLSGSMILLLLGFYRPLIDTTVETMKQVLHGDVSHLGIQAGLLGCFAVGVVLGFFLISKVMQYLLSKYHHATFYSIIGFVVGSVVALFFNFEIFEYYVTWSKGSYIFMPMYIEIPAGIILLGLAIFGSYKLSKLQEKYSTEEQTI